MTGDTTSFTGSVVWTPDGGTDPDVTGEKHTEPPQFKNNAEAQTERPAPT